MKFIYNSNGLPFFTEEDILLKDYLVKIIALKVKFIFKKQNQAWDFIQLESPCLIPSSLVSSNYTKEDVWNTESVNSSLALTLKPETTNATYEYMIKYLEDNTRYLPISFWQVSKSFRREQDQSTKHCRFKEFYQQEFQCLYSKDTKNNYQESIINDLASMFLDVVGLPVRIILSDRLPSYSLKTIDIEVFNGDKWMEICSISLRTDFTYQPMMKNKLVDCYVLEIAIGIDRLIYNIDKRSLVFEDLKVSNTLV